MKVVATWVVDSGIVRETVCLLTLVSDKNADFHSQLRQGQAAVLIHNSCTRVSGADLVVVVTYVAIKSGQSTAI